MKMLAGYTIINLLLIPLHMVYLFGIGWEAEKISIVQYGVYGITANVGNLILFLILRFLVTEKREENKKYFWIFFILTVLVYVLLGADNIIKSAE